MISQTWDFLIIDDLCPFVCNFAIKLAFVMSMLAYGVNFTHTNATFTKGLTCFYT